MRKLLSTFYKKEEDDSNSSASSPNKNSLLRGGTKSFSSLKIDNSNNTINLAATTLADSIQNILSKIANFSSEDLSEYQSLLDVLDSRNSHMSTLLLFVDSSNFVEACFQSNLATGLYQALRLLRMLELIQSKSVTETDSCGVTLAASSNVSRILEKLCCSPVIIEQLRPSLVKLLIFPLNPLPTRGKHLQNHSSKIVSSICRNGFTSQQVWFLHDCHYVNYALRALSEMVDMGVTTTKEDNMLVLRGASAEIEEMWLEALKCLVEVLSTSLLVSSALLTDFELLGGSKLFLHILKNSSSERYLRYLNFISSLMVSALKKDEEIVQFNSVTALFSEFLVDLLKIDRGLEKNENIQALIEIGKAILHREVIVRDKEFLFQGLSYSILTLYSTEPSACAILEDKYNVLPTLMLCLPAFCLEESISAILTTFNYICQCVESNSPMIFVSMSSSLYVLLETTTNPRYPTSRRVLASHCLDLCFSSIEAVTRSNPKYSIIFLRSGVLKTAILGILEKLSYDTRSGVQLSSEESVVFEKVLFLLSDLILKSPSVIDDVRKSRVSSILIEIARSTNISAGFVKHILLLFEEIVKTEGTYSEVSLKDIFTLLLSENLQIDKMRCILDSMWKLLICGEGKALPSLANIGKTSILRFLNNMKNIFSNQWDQELLPYMDCLESLLRFCSLFLFYSGDNVGDHFFVSQIAVSLIQTGIFSSLYANHGVALLLEFATLFTKDKSKVDRNTSELLLVVPLYLDKQGIKSLISCLYDYLFQDDSKCALLGECDVLAQFFEAPYVSAQGDLALERKLEEILCLISRVHRSEQLTICVQRFLLRPLGLARLDALNWSSFIKQHIVSSSTISSPNQSKKLLEKSFERKLQDYFPDFEGNLGSRNIFRRQPSFDLPIIKLDEDYVSLGSLALFFNESTVLLPAASITISCWFCLDESCLLGDILRGYPLFSLETVVDRVVICVELTSEPEEMNLRFSNLDSGKEEIIKFRSHQNLRVNLSSWTNVILTMKRTRRFAQSNQITSSLFINGLACFVMNSSGSSSTKSALDFDCLTSSQHGEIRLGFSKQAVSNSSSLKILGKVHFATLSIFNEILAQKQIASLFLKGPNYLGLHKHYEHDFGEQITALSTYSLRIGGLISENSLMYVQQLGLKGIESIVAPKHEQHEHCVHTLDLPELPDTVAVISPSVSTEDSFSISLIEDRNTEARLLPTSAFSTFHKETHAISRPRRFSLFNVMDLDSGNLIGVLNSPGFITHQLSLSDRVFSIGGIDTLMPLLLLSDDENALNTLLKLLNQISKENIQNIRRMQVSGYRMLGFILHFMTLKCFRLSESVNSLTQFGVETSIESRSHLLIDTVAFSHLVFNHHVWDSSNFDLFAALLKQMRLLVTDNKYKNVNIIRLSCLGFVRWIVLGCLQLVINSAQNNMTENYWPYRPRTSLEMADRRDEPEDYLVDAHIVVCALMTSELRSKDLELVVNTVQYTLNYDEEGNRIERSKSTDKNPCSLEQIKELVDLHPYCTYEEELLFEAKKNAQQQHALESENWVNYLTPFEFYRINLLRLLLTLYDENSDEMGTRRLSTTTGNNASNNFKLNAESLDLYREKCSADWFLSVLERTEEIATRSQILRLLAYFLEKDNLFAREFIDARGVHVLQSILCSRIQTVPVLLPLCSIIFRLPNQLLLYPSQLKSVQKFTQLVELEELVDFTYMSESWLTQYSLPLLSIFYECLIKVIRREANYNWLQRAEELLVGMLDSAVHFSAPFKRLMQHKLAIEIHINCLLSCSNAFSDYGSLVYGVKKDSVDLTKAIEEDYISLGKPSFGLFDQSGNLDSQSAISGSRSVVDERLKQEKIIFSNTSTCVALQRMINYFLRYAIREEDNSRILYHLFLSSSALTSYSYECSYQTIIIQIFSEVAKESQGLENSIIASIVRNIIYLIPLVRGLYFYDSVTFELMKVCVSLVETISSMYEPQELTENLQFILKDLVANARFFGIVLIFMLQNSPFKCDNLSRLQLLVYIRTKIDYFFHPFIEDVLEVLIYSSRFPPKSGIDEMTLTATPMLEALQGLTTSSLQRKSTVGLISNIRLDRGRCSGVFCAFLACTSYYLVLDEEAQVRIEATRILAFLSQRRGYYMEQLLGNSSHFVSRVCRGIEDDSGLGVDIYREGLLKLVPNSEGKYQLFLRGGTDDNESEDNRFADFSFWISDNSNKCDAVFRAIDGVLQSILPNMNSEYEELTRRLKHKPRARDLFCFENAESVKASLRRQQVAQNNGQKINKVYLTWRNEGLKELTSGAILWKKAWNNLKSSPLWGYGRIYQRGDTSSEKSKSQQIARDYHARIVWKVDYCEGPEKCRKKLQQDLTYLSPVLFGFVPARSTVSFKDRDNQSIDDILQTMQKRGLFRRMSTRQNDSNFDESNFEDLIVGDPNSFVFESDNSIPKEPVPLYALSTQLKSEQDEFEEYEDVIEGTGEESERDFDFQEDKIEDEEELPLFNGFNPLSSSQKSAKSPRITSLTVSRSSVVKEIIKGIISVSELKNCRVFNVERISGLETQRGIFVLSDNFLHLLLGFVVQEKNNKFSDSQFDWIPQLGSNPPERRKDDFPKKDGKVIEDTFLPRSIWSELMMTDSPYIRISIEEIYSFFKRRFQLKYSALEVSDVRGSSVLFSCESVEDCDEILTVLLEKDLPTSIFNKMIGLKNLQLLRGATNMYYRLVSIFLSTVTQLWQHGEITNFEYLMYINSAAGRSFLDLTQYPIFPWILSDYKSEELDLDDPTIYRDLSKPMGALGFKRSQQYLERYQTMDEFYREGVEGSSPPFFYGTHYSCAGYVLHYLVRLQPYANMSLALQGGSFDKADRLFCNVESSWISASSENLQDVRELIPEFYYLPDFLVNINQFDLGVTQSERRVDNVKLPPWALNDPNHFIEIHRQALESKYVSENLHNWIDLIFGFKQRGKAAIDAMNVFIHITYEGEVDLDAIDDPILQNATLAQINNFGQTPTKLFPKPHPRKIVPEVVKKLNDTILVEPTALAWHSHLSPPLTVVGASKFVILKCVNFGQATFVYGNGRKGSSTNLAVADIKLISRDKILACSFGSVFLPPNFRKIVKFHLVVNGLAFQTFHSYVTPRLENEREISYHEHLHNKKITALSICKNGEFIVTGSEDLTVRIWQLTKQNYNTHHRKLSAVCMFNGHTSQISCLDISVELNIVVSGGADRRAIIWDYRSESMIRILSDHTGGLVSVAINTISGNIVTLTKEQIRIYHLNGHLLCKYSFENLDTKKIINPASSVIAPPCGDWQDGVVAVTGHFDGSVFLWKISKLTRDTVNNPKKDEQETFLEDQFPTEKTSIYSMYIASSLPRIHKREISCLRLCSTTNFHGNKSGKELINKAYEESRNLDLFVGDIEGNVSRWTSAKLDQLPPNDLTSLLKLDTFISKA